MGKLFPVFLEGDAKTVEEANKIAERYQYCPYVAFMATTENRVHITYFLPEEQRWWVEEIEKEPRHLGLEKVKLVFPQKTYFPKEMNIHLPQEKTATHPCSPESQIDCSKCPGYSRCLGCPATIHYKRK